MASFFLLPVRVSPHASRAGVGGAWADPDGPPRVLVRVTAAPEDGRANRAVTTLIARELGLPSRAVTVERGATHRNKMLRIAAEERDHAATIARWLAPEASNG